MNWQALGASSLAILAAIGMGDVASAQQTSATTAAPASNKIDEVVVTADRQGGTKLQNLPMAVTAIGAKELNKLNLTGLSDYASLAPSVYVQEQGPGVNNIVIRGLSTRGLSVSEIEDRSLVAVYIDDMPVTMKSGNPDLKILDLADVEVLRGPQGTLYGAGSMAGTIRQVTIKPDMRSTHGYLETADSITTGSGGLNGNVRGMLNLPLIEDKLALRVNGYTGYDSGYIDDLGIGKKRVNGVEESQGRIALRAEPSSRLTLDASMIYAKEHGGLNDGYTGLGSYKFTSLAREHTRDNMQLYNFAIDYDAGFAHLISSTSVMHRSTYYLQDQGFIENASVFADSFPVQADHYTIRNTVNDLVEELRFVSNGAGPFRWTGGVFFEDGSRDFREDEPYANLDSEMSAYYGGLPYNSQTDALAFSPNDFFSGTQYTRDKQVAVFAEAKYSFLDRFQATVGLRYFDWSESYRLWFGGYFGDLQGGYPGGGAPVPETSKSSASANGFNPRFVLDYHLTDHVLLYAEAAKGFRFGGNNQPVPQPLCTSSLQAVGRDSAPSTFGPDSLWSYTVAEKGRFLDGRLNLNLTGFWVNWNQTQSTVTLGCAYYFTENIGEVQSKGLELESALKVLPHLTVSLNASYTDSQTAQAVPALQIASGQQAPYAPRYVGNLSVDYAIPTSQGSLNLAGNWSYKSVSTNMFDAANPQYRRIPAADNLSLALTYQLHGFEAGLFADNLTNGTKIVDYDRFPSTVGAPGDRVYYARPRTIGFRVRGSF